MPSNWTKALPTKKKKERSQPEARAHRGILEKKKDYQFRNAVKKDKERFMKELRQQAQNKNPQEFNYKMVSALKPLNESDIKIVKKVNELDKNYIGLYRATEKKRLEKIQAHLAIHSKKPSHEHTIFVSDDESEENNRKKVSEFSKTEYFETIPQAVNRRHNRPTKKQLEEDNFILNNYIPDFKEIQKQRTRKQKEYRDQKSRVDKISKLQEQVEAKSRELTKRKKGTRQK